MRKLLLVLMILSVFEAQAQVNKSSHYFIYSNTLNIDSDSIYEGHNYEYYAGIYKKATSLHRAGIGVTSAGAGIFLVGAILIINSDDIDDNDRKAGDILLISGFISLNAGIPLWIVGGRMKINNRKAMEKTQRGVEFSFRLTNNGVGLVMNF